MRLLHIGRYWGRTARAQDNPALDGNGGQEVLKESLQGLFCYRSLWQMRLERGTSSWGHHSKEKENSLPLNKCFLSWARQVSYIWSSYTSAKLFAKEGKNFLWLINQNMRQTYIALPQKYLLCIIELLDLKELREIAFLLVKQRLLGKKTKQNKKTFGLKLTVSWVFKTENSSFRNIIIKSHFIH